jgi:mannose-6-phosphate isomerase-like protein (cupin superfamily)
MPRLQWRKPSEPMLTLVIGEPGAYLSPTNCSNSNLTQRARSLTQRSQRREKDSKRGLGSAEEESVYAALCSLCAYLCVLCVIIGPEFAELHDVPGGGPPPHIHHREDETFQILEGEYEWKVGGKTFIAQKGTTIFAPRGIPHTYRYLGKTPGRLLCVITPSGFEAFFEEIGALSPQQQQDIPRVIEIGKKYGLEFPPPPS